MLCVLCVCARMCLMRWLAVSGPDRKGRRGERIACKIIASLAPLNTSMACKYGCHSNTHTPVISWWVACRFYRVSVVLSVYHCVDTTVSWCKSGRSYMIFAARIEGFVCLNVLHINAKKKKWQEFQVFWNCEVRLDKSFKVMKKRNKPVFVK